MSAETVSATDAGRGRAGTIYVALLDEGLDVWRPVAAEVIDAAIPLAAVYENVAV